MGYATGHRWTDEEIVASIRYMVDDLELKRMPTRNEVASYYGNSMACAVTRRIGWYNLARQLGLHLKECETTVGKLHEHLLAEELTGMGFQVQKMPQNFPYDLLIDDAVKIDVKASKLYRGKQGNFYTFNLEKPFCTCDIYALRLLNDDETILETLIVPGKDVARNTQISVGQIKSKYYKYAKRWDIIRKYSDFSRSISCTQ